MGDDKALIVWRGWRLVGLVPKEEKRCWWWWCDVVFPVVVKAEVNHPLPTNGLDRLGSSAKYKNPLDPILIPRLIKNVQAPFV